MRARPARRWRLTRTLVGAAAALVLVLAGIAYAVGLLPFASASRGESRSSPSGRPR